MSQPDTQKGAQNRKTSTSKSKKRKIAQEPEPPSCPQIKLPRDFVATESGGIIIDGTAAVGKSTLIRELVDAPELNLLLGGINGKIHKAAAPKHLNVVKNSHSMFALSILIHSYEYLSNCLETLPEGKRYIFDRSATNHLDWQRMWFVLMRPEPNLDHVREYFEHVLFSNRDPESGYMPTIYLINTNEQQVVDAMLVRRNGKDVERATNFGCLYVHIQNMYYQLKAASNPNAICVDLADYHGDYTLRNNEIKAFVGRLNARLDHLKQTQVVDCLAETVGRNLHQVSYSTNPEVAHECDDICVAESQKLKQTVFGMIDSHTTLT